MKHEDRQGGHRRVDTSETSDPSHYVVHDREWSMATTKPVLQSLESAAVHLKENIISNPASLLFSAKKLFF